MMLYYGSPEAIATWKEAFMNPNVLARLRRVEIFSQLTDEELSKIINICRVERTYPGQIVFKEGSSESDLFVIIEGCVRIAINTRSSDGTVAPGTINMLYAGQSFGEMALLGGAARSATVISVEACVLLVLNEKEFANLCENEPRIGFIVMRNLANDLSYKLRASNLLLRGNIRWQHGELGQR